MIKRVLAGTKSRRKSYRRQRHNGITPRDRDLAGRLLSGLCESAVWREQHSKATVLIVFFGRRFSPAVVSSQPAPAFTSRRSFPSNLSTL